MIDKCIAIGALARNCEENLPGNIERIEELRRHFRSSYVVVYENDSTDKTREILDGWGRKSCGVTIISEHLNGNEYQHNVVSKRFPEKSVARISKMVYLRNRLLSLVGNNGNPDYVAFIDIDLKDFSVNGIIKSLEDAPKDWGAIVANGRARLIKGKEKRFIPLQYDCYAFLPENKEMNKVSPCYYNRLSIFFRSFVFNRKISSNRFWRCKSAFGGFGIYRWNAISELNYKVVIPFKMAPYSACICEHIPFHNDISNQGYSIYVSQDLITTYYFKHINNSIKDWLYWHFTFLYSLFAVLFNH